LIHTDTLSILLRLRLRVCTSRLRVLMLRVCTRRLRVLRLILDQGVVGIFAFFLKRIYIYD